MASMWYLARDGQQFGPFSSRQLKEFVTSGRLQAEDLVWKEGMSTWVAASRIKGLFTHPTSEAEEGVTTPTPAITCPHCAGSMSVNLIQAGQTFACPHCAGQFLLPASPDQQQPANNEQPTVTGNPFVFSDGEDVIAANSASLSTGSGSGPGALTRTSPDEARAALLTLFAQHAPGQNARILGAAYWNTLGSVVGTGVSKLVFGVLLGPLGSLTGTEHRAGIVAVTDSDLFLVDLGMVVGEDLTLEKLRGAAGPPSVKKAPLQNLTAECDSRTGVLALKGDLRVKAFFPRVFDQENLSKAALIASAVQSHG